MVRAHGPRWVVTDQGVMLSWVACANCHLSNRRDGTVGVGGPRGPRPPGSLLLNPRVPGAQGSPPVLQRYFVGDSRGTIVSRMFATPWALDDRIEHVKNAGPEELCELANGDPGVFNRPRGSPYRPAEPPLQPLHGCHRHDRLRGPEDVARYAAFISGADPMQFGSYHILSDAQRSFGFATRTKCCSRSALICCRSSRRAIPTWRHPTCLPMANECFSAKVARPVTRRPPLHKCQIDACRGVAVTAPNRADVLPLSVGTDPGLPLRTRKGRASTRFRRCVVRGTGHGCCVTDRSRISRRRRSGAPERRLSVKRSVGILSCFFPFVRWATPYIYWQACVP